jgi:hypothetical protein
VLQCLSVSRVSAATAGSAATAVVVVVDAAAAAAVVVVVIGLFTDFNDVGQRNRTATFRTENSEFGI